MTEGTKMTEETLTENQKSYLGWMAGCHETNVGRLPKTMEELSDHWHWMSDVIVVFEYTDADGRYHAPETVFEVDAPTHMVECNWLHDLQKRPDADALLADAIEISADDVRDDEF